MSALLEVEDLRVRFRVAGLLGSALRGGPTHLEAVAGVSLSIQKSVQMIGGRDGGASGGDARALCGERIAFGVEQVECRLLADADLVANTLEGDRRRARPIGGGLHEGA